MAEKIVIEISPDGKVSGDVAQGPGGAKCLAALYKLLGDLGEHTETRKKPEFYQAEQQGQRRTVKR